MAISTLLSVLVIVCSLAIGVLGFLLREISSLNYVVLALGIVSAAASAATLIINKREMRRINAITNVAAHSMFGGL
jgi:hypothetical protein